MAIVTATYLVEFSPVTSPLLPIEPILRKLGPMRVQQAMIAFDEYSGGRWDGCFLARAYGEWGELQRDALESGANAYVRVLQRRIALTAGEMTTLIQWYDTKPSALAAACREYLSKFDMAKYNTIKANSKAIDELLANLPAVESAPAEPVCV